MGLGFGIGQEQQTKQTQALHVLADIVCSGGPLEVQRNLQELEQRGHIVQDISVGYEDLAIDDELAEEVFDAEWDFSDEDALTVESDAVLSEVFETGPFLTDAAYVLRVFRNEDGRIEIDVPEMGGETYVGRSVLGRNTLLKLVQRREAYCATAEWLMEPGAMKQLASPVEFLSKHKPITQTEFLEVLNAKKDQKILLPSFSKYLGAARLAWSNGSIPLRRLFK